MKTLAKETAQYVEIGRGRLYAIAFGCEHPQAKVLLCGPSPINRLYSLAAWVRWARFLVQHNIAAVRFDYRGTGESAGEFVEMSFNDWVDDVEQMSVWADSKLGKCPLVLHGMGMGGLLAEKTFSSGRGEGLLLWSALTRARDLFDQALIMRLSMDMVHTRLKKRKSFHAQCPIRFINSEWIQSGTTIKTSSINGRRCEASGLPRMSSPA